MERMKTFGIYVFIFIGFFILSILLENGLLLAMYSNISGDIEDTRFAIENESAKACNVNGYMHFDLVNKTGKFLDKAYVKIDLYNRQNLLADTEYIEILGIQPTYSKTFDIKFKANNIKRYSISVVDSKPDKTNILNILGWEIDLTNVFGLGIDLTNVTIFGTKLSDISNKINWENIKASGLRLWFWFIGVASSIPWWGYFSGWMFYVGLL